MASLSSASLDKFARLIAQGHAPIDAAARAGCRATVWTANQARLARPDIAARIAELDPTAAKRAVAPRPTGRKAAPPAAPGPAHNLGGHDRDLGAPPQTASPSPAYERPMTEEEWMAKFAPHLLAEKGIAGL